MYNIHMMHRKNKKHIRSMAVSGAPETPLQIKRKPYRKPPAVAELEQLLWEDDCRKHPHVDCKFIARKKFRDDTANGLTKCIVEFLNLSGCLAERINSTGRYQDRSKTYEDVMGKVRTIGSGQWLPTSGMKGTADISATIAGRSVKIEVKMKDRQSEDQKRYQQRIEAAGGTYLIVRSFTELYEWYNEFTSNGKEQTH